MRCSACLQTMLLTSHSLKHVSVSANKFNRRLNATAQPWRLWKLIVGNVELDIVVVLLMEEIPNNHLGCKKPVVNNELNYQPQLVRRISEPSTVVSKILQHLYPETFGGKYICTPWNLGNDSEPDLRSIIFSNHLTTYVVRIVGKSR